MTCPSCGIWGPDDAETGYSGDDLCPDCARDGWVVASDGAVINERREEADEAEDWLFI